ncbi:hypothetical protein [Lentzea sp. NBRC 102530]|uniref:hypothetical protein n=1 Tax=Lentzea sp. NBRC 102530 TaxID=3032201 RepID=UPI0024A21621|nr:hypothetical protein [Lentzea sp. NBRC 102530]GLY55213.1 hypothetical protein Lesp01_88680 [Lentzea sp. NBRC 102530]
MPETPEEQTRQLDVVEVDEEELAAERAERVERAARALGMKTREIVSVGEHDPQVGGELVEMHDGTHAIVHDNGLVTVFNGEKVDKLSPVAHALNPMVQFADLARAFGPNVGRGSVGADVVAEVAEVVERAIEQAKNELPPTPVEEELVLPPVYVPTPAEPVQVEPVLEQVPDGSAKTVMEWVGDDVARARLALAAEGARPDGPRAGLSKDLTALLAAADNAGGDDA